MRRLLFCLLAVLTASGLLWAGARPAFFDPIEAYDAIVVATIQLRRPEDLRLDVEQVLKGDAPLGELKGAWIRHLPDGCDNTDCEAHLPRATLPRDGTRMILFLMRQKPSGTWLIYEEFSSLYSDARKLEISKRLSKKLSKPDGG